MAVASTSRTTLAHLSSNSRNNIIRITSTSTRQHQKGIQPLTSLRVSNIPIVPSCSSNWCCCYTGVGVTNNHLRLPPLLGTIFPHQSLSFFSSSPVPRSNCASKGTIQPTTTHLIERDSDDDDYGNVVKILEERGLVESLTSEKLKKESHSSAVKVYCGFDPTAESLHLGNLLGIIVLSWFLRCGHSAVALVGGATARVGDPSGKTLERPDLDLQTLETNTAAITRTLRSILNDNKFVVLNNLDWWEDVKLLDFLKGVGRFARVGTMMSKESVRRRLDSELGLSYTEFTYQLLQGYDFVHLFQNHGVNVQIGGSDQWGNITAGTDLLRRIAPPPDSSSQPPQDAAAYGLTFPLLLKSDGTKFGKSEEGAIWLSPSMLSPYKFYQHFFTVPDTDVILILKRLTFLSLDEIAELESNMKTPGYVPNTAQRVLAEEVTRFVHGQQGLNEALKATQVLKPGGGSDTTAVAFDWETIQRIAQDVPSCSLPYDQVLNVPIVDLSVVSGLLESKSAARRLLKQGGLYLNNTRVDCEAKKIESQDIVQGKVLLLSAGKKNRIVVRIS